MERMKIMVSPFLIILEHGGFIIEFDRQKAKDKTSSDTTKLIYEIQC